MTFMLSRRQAIKTVVGATVAASATVSPLSGQAQPPGMGEVTVTLVLARALPEFEDKEIRMMTVAYAPGAVSPPHRHPGPVFAYVLEGSVVTQVGDGPLVTYARGQAWFEPPGAAHRVSRNASATAPARLLAFVIAEKDEPSVLPLQT